MAQQVLDFPAACRAFARGASVVLADGSRGYVQRRHFGLTASGEACVIEYEVQVQGGPVRFAPPNKVFAVVGGSA